MRRGLNNQAYTIVEIMIVLAVSSALLVSALLFVGGQQRKTEFYQSIHDIEQQINDVMNNVSTGYYAKTTNYKCAVVGGVVTFDPTIDQPQGTNQGCIFIGRAIQFAVQGTDYQGFNIYNLVGKRYSSGTTEVKSIIEAQPNAMATGLTDNTDRRTLKYGLEVFSMRYNNSSFPTGVVAFVTDFAKPASGGLESGSRTAKLYAISGTSRNQLQVNAVNAIESTSPFNFVDPTTDVAICFNSGGTDQSGMITIGSENRQLSTKLEIFNSMNCTP